jgi:hypothetical protein
MEISISTWVLLVTSSSCFYASPISGRAPLTVTFTERVRMHIIGLETLAIKVVIQHSKDLFINIKKQESTLSV